MPTIGKSKRRHMGVHFTVLSTFSVGSHFFKIKNLGNKGENLKTRISKRENKQRGGPGLSPTSRLTLGKVLNVPGSRFPV